MTGRIFAVAFKDTDFVDSILMQCSILSAVHSAGYIPIDMGLSSRVGIRDVICCIRVFSVSDPRSSNQKEQEKEFIVLSLMAAINLKNLKLFNFLYRHRNFFLTTITQSSKKYGLDPGSDILDPDPGVKGGTESRIRTRSIASRNITLALWGGGGG
jgi:hypothetical protein